MTLLKKITFCAALAGSLTSALSLAQSDPMKAFPPAEEGYQRLVINLPKVKEWKAFVTAVQDELTKAATTNATIQQLKTDFESHLNGDVIKNFASLQQFYCCQSVYGRERFAFRANFQQCKYRFWYQHRGLQGGWDLLGRFQQRWIPRSCCKYQFSVGFSIVFQQCGSQFHRCNSLMGCRS